LRPADLRDATGLRELLRGVPLAGVGPSARPGGGASAGTGAVTAAGIPSPP
ncbi:MAG: hypothetical protein QOG76_3873, partial [Pseudonocardiales bacterium]|nr:hypothetical protein [Pseudonocardiales bacterium]